MKILSISNYFYIFGGAERVCFNIRELLMKKGDEVIDFSMEHKENQNSNYSEYFAKHVDFSDRNSFIGNIKRGPSVVYNKDAKRRLKELIKKTNPDVALVHNVGRRLSNSVFDALFEEDVPIAHMLHDYKPNCSINSFFVNNRICEKCIDHSFYHATTNRCNRGSISASFFDSVEKYYHWHKDTYSKIDLFIAPSSFIKEKLSKGGLNKDKIVVIPHFIEVAAREKFLHKDYVIFFGRIDYGKGVETLVSAFKEMPEINLKVVGSGPLKDSIKQETENDKNIEFTGRLEFSDLMNLVEGARFVVVPSEWYEVFGMVIIEAMSKGKPVIGSRIGGITELIKDGKNGYLYTPGDKRELIKIISNLYHDEDLIRKMGLFAYDFAKSNFNKDGYYEKLISNLKKIKEIHEFEK